MVQCHHLPTVGPPCFIMQVSSLEDVHSFARKSRDVIGQRQDHGAAGQWKRRIALLYFKIEIC